MHTSAVPISEICSRRRARTAASCVPLTERTSAARRRSFISAAASFVKVTASTDDTSASPARMREIIFSIITKVLPLPAEADTSTCPGAAMAACCSCVGLRSLIVRFSS